MFLKILYQSKELSVSKKVIILAITITYHPLRVSQLR